MGKNKVFIAEDGIIEILVRGDQTVELTQATGDEALRLGNLQLEAGNSLLILDNLTDMGKVPAEARKRVVELLKTGEYDRFAMFGSSPLIRLGANLLLQATGKGNRVKHFDDRESAIAWLKHKKIHKSR